jgi:hypothetical protein
VGFKPFCAASLLLCSHFARKERFILEFKGEIAKVQAVFFEAIYLNI